jgi:ABC-type sugar transport system substrate-binding protein
MGLTVAAGSAFAGGRKAAPKTAGEIKSIGISLYYQRDEWYVGVYEEFEKQGKARGFTVYQTDADGNSQKQVEQVENLISQQVDLMMIAPVDDNGVVSLIEQVRQAGIPVLAYGTQPGGGDYFTFVGWDVYQTGFDLGKEAAQYIKTSLGGKAMS